MATFRFEATDRAVSVSPSANEEEAAAIVAALDLALGAEGSTGSDERESTDPWLRAARFEAVRGAPYRPHPDAPHDPWVAMGRNRR